MNETYKFIQSKYGIKPNISSSSVKPPIELKKKKISVATSSYAASREVASEHRELANEYFQIRQMYFEKASEAHQRGWGGVAQYYAEMVFSLLFFF